MSNSNPLSAALVLALPTYTTLGLGALKSTGVVDWSWWWITSPLWLYAALTAAVVFYAVVMVSAWKD